MMLDFFTDFIFGDPDFNGVYGFWQLLPAIAGTAYGAVQNKKREKQLGIDKNIASDKYDTAYNQIKNIDFSAPQSSRDAFTSQMEAGREISDNAKTNVDATVARSLAALRDNSRAMNSAGIRAIDSSLKAQQDADMKGAEYKLSGELGLADLDKESNSLSINRDMNLFSGDQNMAATAFNTSQQGIYDTQNAMTSMIQNLGNLGTEAIIGKNKEEPKDPKDPKVTEQGGYIGENGMMTEGEFNHDTNEKLLVDKESGEIDAKLTGDEMIVLNPDQQDGMFKVANLLKQLATQPNAPKEILMALENLQFLDEPQFQNS